MGSGVTQRLIGVRRVITQREEMPVIIPREIQTRAFLLVYHTVVNFDSWPTQQHHLSGAMCPGGCHASVGWIHQIKRRKWYQIEARNQQANMLILSFSCDAVEVMEKCGLAPRTRRGLGS